MSSNNNFYNKLLKEYTTKFGDKGKEILEKHIINLMREYLCKRDEAIRLLYEELEKRKIIGKEYVKTIKINGVEAYLKYDGYHYGIIYLPITEFENELHCLGKLLDFIEKNLGNVVLIVPNVGISHLKVIGFAVIFKKHGKEHRIAKSTPNIKRLNL